MSLEKLGEAYFCHRWRLIQRLTIGQSVGGKIQDSQRRKTCNICLSQTDLISLMWLFPVASIFLQMAWFCSSFWLKTFHYVIITHLKKIHSTVKGHLDLVPNLCIVKSYSKYLWPNISCKVQRVPPAIPLHTKGQAHWLIQNWVLA